MPNVYGNAKDFFDASLPAGVLNPKRGMIQYANGGNEAPMPDDLLVSTDNACWHVAIISIKNGDSVDVDSKTLGARDRPLH